MLGKHGILSLFLNAFNKHDKETLIKNPLYILFYTSGEIYTLIMVDADIANPVVGNATHPLVFWLVTNIREGNMSTGTVVPTKSDSDVIFCLQWLSKI